MASFSVASLGDVCCFDKEQGIHSGLPYVGLEDIESDTGKFLGTKSPASVKSSTFRFSSQHLLYGRLRPYLNKVMLPNFEGHCSTEIFPIRPSQQVIREYIFYWLLMDSTAKAIDATSTGARMPRANMSAVLDFEIPVPTLVSQRRIVAILDEAFEGIAAAKANAEKNLQNARELFETSLDAALSSHEKGRIDTTLGNEADLLAGYAFSSKSYTHAASGVRLLRGDNIMQGYLRWDDAKHWPVDDLAPHARFALQQGDVVLAMDRPWVKAGLKRAQIGEDDLPCLQLQRTARLRPKQRMRLDFLFHLVGSRSFSQHLLGVQTGLGVPHISGKQIEGFQFMLPSMIKQAAIASALNDLQQQTGRLEGIYDQKISALEELKKSLLHQAFTGQL